jgi:type IV pilus assembly protein PilM
MIRFTRAQAQPIGVDIGSASVKLLQMEMAGPSLSVIAAARQQLPSGSESEQWPERTSAAADLIRYMLRHNPFSGRKVIAALPPEIVQIKNLRLPPMPVEELRSAIEFEAKNIFPFESKDAHIRFLHAGEVRQGTDVRQEVIVIAALRSDVDAFLCRLHRSGAIVESLDCEPCSIYRSIERFIRRREDEQEVNVLVDVGGARTQVVIGRGETISFYKSIEIAGRHLTDAVALKLGITSDEALALRRRLFESSGTNSAAGEGPRDPVRQAVIDATRSITEDLAREVSLCLRYHSVTFRGHRPVRVRLIGGEGADPQLLSAFTDALPIPTETGRPLHSVDTSHLRTIDRRGFMSEWTTAFGLSLKLTTGRFGARDGKPRSPAPPSPSIGGVAEVVDISGAFEASSAPAAFASDPVSKATSRRREVVHA